jgi:GntR family transcriptional regulator
MILNLSDMSPEPLYEQIIRQIRAQVLSSNLEPGTSLPSIRELARQTKVSVITIQKAYDRLSQDKILISRRGKGYFVATFPGSGKTDLARIRCTESLRKSIEDALQEGLRTAEIRKIVDSLISESKNEALGRRKM